MEMKIRHGSLLQSKTRQVETLISNRRYDNIVVPFALYLTLLQIQLSIEIYQYPEPLFNSSPDL